MLAAVNSIFTRAFIRECARSYARYTKRKNPGTDRTLSALRENRFGSDVEDAESIHEFQEAEPDFSKLASVQKQHESETRRRQTRIRNLIVEQKYFKENSPNLLTWSEKEQIRYLHGDNPEEWTPKKIAECFPVTEETVKKIIKIVWKPASEKRINRHDASALRNWKELKEGTLEGISPELRERFLNMFSHRVIPPRRPENIQETVQVSLGEFGMIVGGYESDNRALSDKKTYLNDLNRPKLLGKEERASKIDKNHLTFEELQLNIRDRLENKHDIEETDKLIMSYKVNENINQPNDPQLEMDIAAQTRNTEITPIDIDKNILKPLSYPEVVKIPKNLWQKGKTYKVDDCYYDDDGTFLYRVPGMIL